MNPPANRARGFSRAQRLTRPSEFTRVMNQATRSADRYFTVLARPGTATHSRLGLAISKKAARRAVDRNRIKRLAREAFRHCELPGQLDLVVFARPGAAAQLSAVLRRSLDRHFAELHAGRAR